MKPLNQVFLIVLGAAVNFTVAGGAASSTVESHASDGQPTYQQFIAARSFPYQTSDARQEKLVRAYSGLALGMSKSAVLGVLGPPDYSAPMYSKETGKYIGGKWVYVLYQLDGGGASENQDREIVVYFDRSDNADWIIPKNLPGLTDLRKSHGS